MTAATPHPKPRPAGPTLARRKLGSLPARHEPPTPRDSFRLTVVEETATMEAELGGSVWDGHWLPSMVRAGQLTSSIRALVDPGDPDIRTALAMLACTAAAVHLAALTPGEDPVPALAPGGRRVMVDRSGGYPAHLSPVQLWPAGLRAALVVRDRAATATLASIGWDDLVRHIRHPAAAGWFESEQRALTAVVRGEADASSLVDTARMAAEASSHKWATKIVAPALDLLGYALRDDQSGYDVAWVQALKRHHNYYGTTGRDDPYGQLALYPLAVASVAFDRGITTPVDSDYAPRWLIERR